MKPSRIVRIGKSMEAEDIIQRIHDTNDSPITSIACVAVHADGSLTTEISQPKNNERVDVMFLLGIKILEQRILNSWENVS